MLQKHNSLKSRQNVFKYLRLIKRKQKIQHSKEISQQIHIKNCWGVGLANLLFYVGLETVKIRNSFCLIVQNKITKKLTQVLLELLFLVKK